MDFYNFSTECRNLQNFYETCTCRFLQSFYVEISETSTEIVDKKNLPKESVKPDSDLSVRIGVFKITLPQAELELA